MLCDICKKNEATIHIKELHSGEIHTANLCSTCASEKEKNGELSALGFNLAEMLCNLGKISSAIKSHQESPAESATVCPKCGWTIGRIKNSGGRLGCPTCYNAFAPMLSEAIQNVHRGSVHLGKRMQSASPDGRVALETELSSRRHELDALVKREEYEQAAVCRDKINQLKAALDKMSTDEASHE
ncbi:MAG: UvrB/UvrC motif-containing protein [Victivallales bacterium]|jgi:protein arginine kinase activator|nr:UvrB/UvrC motif-containing protein [Victivallales bacterium]